MIVVTVELWRGGNPADREHLGTAKIANDGTGTDTIGNYKAMFSRKGSPETPWRLGVILGFPRKRLGAWDLLCWALLSVVGGRIPNK